MSASYETQELTVYLNNKQYVLQVAWDKYAAETALKAFDADGGRSRVAEASIVRGFVTVSVRPK